MKSWLSTIETTVLSMAVLRLIGGSLEVTIALLMLFFNDPKKSLALNSILAMVGPFILLSTIAIGVAGVAQELSFSKLVFVGIGVTCILIGVFK
ncbi:YqhV family protein [Priestia taiwanensis]|uniref:DUF2619 domain-containing protein n=1 Tax=Priestia taiwanensis TaxID=1347902 RepID=A0A917AIB1_9BACI|nr:YqhV family protein [Priestia taiwanensis]MBM7361388.1 hypothetical protein [Priestia taiwanensis]GGE53771.1 hypothetical protein GCM10007140_00100 [Priestia taiwanensis]